MSIEHKIEQLTKAVELLTTVMQSSQVSMIADTPAPVINIAPLVNVTTHQEPVMPALPVFTPPAITAPTPIEVPFNDGKSLVDYVMKRYRELGAEKGVQIQEVLTSMGYQNINNVKPEQYLAFFTGVEGIK